MSFTRSRTFSQIAPGQAAKENTNQSQLPSAARLDRPKIKTKANRSEPRQSRSRSERFSARQAEIKTKANILRPSGKLARKNTNQSQISEPRLVARQFLIPNQTKANFRRASTLSSSRRRPVTSKIKICN